MTTINRAEKYDRQLRLWASSGQRRLEIAKVLVCQPTLTALEVLKNLILPGIGHFTVLSERKSITEHDLAANFYLADDDLGRDFAECVVEKLGELNEDVGSTVLHVERFQEWIVSVTEEFWKSYDLVILPYQYQHQLERLCQLNVPTIVINTVGFYGFMRVVTQGFEVVETHPEALLDTRIMTPWPELKEYVDSIDLSGMDVEQHSAVPFLVIQMKALDHWRSTHDGEVPKTNQEKNDYKELIRSWRKEWGQLNFDEAMNNSRKVFTQTKVRSNVQDIFDKLPEYFDNESKRTVFWILVKALKSFVEMNDGFLPLKGELPDMDSSTEQYIALQNVYRTKAEKDLASFKGELNHVLAQIDTSVEIPEDTIRTFVKNANHLFFSANSSMPLSDKNFSNLIGGDFSESAVVLLSYLLIENYILENNAFPGFDSLDSLVEKSHEFYMSDDDSLLHKVMFEMIRSQGVELGNIAALMGGIGGQEAIKLVTKQYIPLDNTLVFDGVHSVTEKWKVDH